MGFNTLPVSAVSKPLQISKEFPIAIPIILQLPVNRKFIRCTEPSQLFFDLLNLRGKFSSFSPLRPSYSH